MPTPNHPTTPSQPQRSTTMHSPTTSHRPRLRGWLVPLVATVVAACALPASASAATLHIVGDTVLHQGSGAERNNVSVREVAGALIVSDTARLFHSNAAFTPGNRCVPIDRQTMRCPRTRFEARMGDGDDTAGPINTDLPVEINGGDGEDTYQAGNPSFLTNVEFRGGPAADTVSYAGSAGTVGGQGVRISNDGVANDGRIGLDTDNIGQDVSRLTGSAFADEITANGPAGCCSTVVTGGQGDDVLRVGSTGNHVTILNGPVADGADKIIGGPVPSTVSYGQRTRQVNATLNFGGADDGEAGERDELLGGHEEVFGGQASDILQAPALSRASHAISGGGGNDQLDGAEGADRLTGGPGGDTVRAFGGNDQVFVKDGELDTVSCGEGTDTFEVDSFDNFAQAAALCENGTVGVLRLAPKRLRARAGEPARLKLSWRHPRSWRQLRRVTLRLYRGDSWVGAVAISPRSRRIADRGGLTVLRRSRLVRKGKTVSAQLALRLHRSLAGQRLRIEIAAVDVRGARQLERRAGSIRVSR
jgi:hypothetical protein